MQGVHNGVKGGSDSGGRSSGVGVRTGDVMVTVRGLADLEDSCRRSVLGLLTYVGVGRRGVGLGSLD